MLAIPIRSVRDSLETGHPAEARGLVPERLRPAVRQLRQAFLFYMNFFFWGGGLDIIVATSAIILAPFLSGVRSRLPHPKVGLGGTFLVPVYVGC